MAQASVDLVMNPYWNEIQRIVVEAPKGFQLPSEICSKIHYLQFLEAVNTELEYHYFLLRTVNSAKHTAIREFLNLINTISKHLLFKHPGNQQDFFKVSNMCRDTMVYLESILTAERFHQLNLQYSDIDSD